MIQRPYNIKVNGIMVNGNTIDPTLSNTFSWSSSGDISTAFQVQIYNNVTGNLVYDSTKQTSYNTYFALPANSIPSNNVYKIIVTAFDVNGNSASSYSVIFSTSLTPVVTIVPISNPVGSQTYNFSATYSQSENVAMTSYLVYLYDANGNLLAQSNAQTGSTIEYMFSGLQSGDTYQVEFECTSAKGLTGTTGLVSFNVQYDQPYVNTQLTATNNSTTGTIDLSWTVIQVIGQTDISGTVNYINNEMVDLTGGNNIWFSNGFNVDQDFTMKIWLQSPVHNVDLLTMYGANGKITLQYQDDNQFHLYKAITSVNDPLTRTHLVSGVVNATTYCVIVQQIGQNMNLFADVVN